MVRSAGYEKPKVPPVIRISGSEPGALDPTQPDRLLRTSKSTLSFASFDPYIASANDVNLAKLSINEEPCRPKRIVIETVIGHGSFWRWVPSARKMEDVEDEGTFPRVINICGSLVECSQDQWDIYKLDPKYDCLVKFPPALTVVSIKESQSPFNDATPKKSKPDVSTASTPPDDESDVDRMIIDDDNRPVNSDPPKRKSRAARPMSPREPHHFDFAFPPSTSEDPKPKKRANMAFQGLRPTDEEENEYFQEDSNNRNTRFYTPKYQKRARTLSPESKKRSLNAHKTSRRNAKQEKWEREKEARKEQRERHFLRDILSDLPPAHANANSGSDSKFADIPEEDEAPMPDCTIPVNGESFQSNPERPTEEEGAQRLAESLKKMQELNADRDMQRERERRDRGEKASTSRANSEDPNIAYRKKQKLDEETQKKEEEKRKQDEESRRQAEENRRKEARAQQEEQAKLRKEQEARRARQERLEHFEQERRTRHHHWNNGMWNSERAMERYRVIGAFFDKTRFTKDDRPLATIDIPWPSLRHPHVNSARDMDWESVTYFFNAIKEVSRGQAFSDVVKISLQRFHPDRWRSRNLYSAIEDEDERNEVETAVSTVSKAIGALWAELKS
ncbi:hypothetical protein BDN70DRAFT_936821 [Pholiota conissans]|uniref:Uncharacterized protein n=1 Tax=Pholiota conissans TaxID=109636 RepID=A0A9P6CUV3_9AGAR|nr:hypothetical protein BDN70DRAFT_936821 [Pholiota conissans]